MATNPNRGGETGNAKGRPPTAPDGDNELPDDDRPAVQTALDKPVCPPGNETQKKAAANLFNTYIQDGPSILKCLAKRYGHRINAQDTEDSLSEAFTEALAEISSAASPPDEWLRDTDRQVHLLNKAANCAARRVRRRRRHQPTDPQAHTLTTLAQGAGENADDLVEDALRVLTNAQRDVWLLHQEMKDDRAVGQGGSLYDRMAETLNTTPGAVRGLITRIRKRLQAYMRRRLSATPPPRTKRKATSRGRDTTTPTVPGSAQPID